MGRPREFEEDVVVDRARDCFWANGVSATSVTDLSEATGLSVGSIYKAFASKDGLQHRTLDDYLTTAIAAVEAVLASGATPLEGIEAWLADAVERASDDSPTRGCYAVACTVELAETDPVVRDMLRRHDTAVRALLADSLARAVANGELHCNPADGARLLAVTASGLQVEARKGISADDARATLALALDALR